MSLKDQISSDLKNAMKAKDKERVSVLRMLLSEVKYAQAANNAQEELPEAEVLKVIGTYHKRLVKSLDDFPDEDKKAELANCLRIYLHCTKGGQERCQADFQECSSPLLLAVMDEDRPPR